MEQRILFRGYSAPNIGRVMPLWKFFFFKLFVAAVAVQIFNATRHIEAAAIAMMYMYLYSLAFMDHQCILGATVCH